MSGWQVGLGRSPSMLAAYNCVLIISDNTNKEKERTKIRDRTLSE